MSQTAQPKLRVHVTTPPPSIATRRSLEEAIVPTIELNYGPQQAPRATEVLVCGRPTRAQLEELPQLRVLVVPYAGIPQPTRDVLLAGFPQLVVCNLHHNAAAAAELAVTLLLAAGKTIVPTDVGLRRGDWRSRYGGGGMLVFDGKNALILGLGAIGTRVAAVCHSLGMNVHAVRRRLEGPQPPNVVVHDRSSLASLLPEADAVAICLPLTSDTEGLLGEQELNSLRPSAVLVNVARGTIVDEEALFTALSERRIAAAGIDVWYQYPSTAEERESTPPSRFPFWELDNVVMSPHRGGAFGNEEMEQRRMQELAATLNAIARGEPIPQRVDLSAGY